MRFHPLIATADQALALQPVLGRPGLRAQRTGQMPVALGVHARRDCGPCPCPQGQQVAKAVAHRALPLLVAHVDRSPQPLVHAGRTQGASGARAQMLCD